MKPLINLFKFEIKQNLKSLLTWFLVIGLILTLYSIMFPSFKSSDMMEVVNAKMSAFPEAMTQAMGLDSYFNFQDIMYYSSYMFQFVVIAMIFYATSLGSRILSKEHSEKHIDYLAVKPINKSHIIIAKYFAFLALLTILSTAIAGLIFIIVSIFKEPGSSSYVIEIARMSVKLLSVYAVFGSLSFLLTAFSKTTKKTSMLVMGIFFASYVLGIVAKMTDGMENFKYLSPYFMFETVKSYSGFNNQDLNYLLILLAVSFIMLIFSFIKYKNKDLSLN